MAKGITVPQYRRWIAGFLAAMIGLGPMATPGYAALTLLGDQPLSVQNQSKPNIMLTIDDSTSMLYDFLPDTAIRKFCRDATGKMNAACGRVDSNFDLTLVGHGKYTTAGYIYEQFGFPFPAYDASFDTSGPGAGCQLTPFITSSCTGGVDPGPLPGLERYPGPPGPGKSPSADKPYEYWSLWPAPVHNTELNHAYYNPRLDYEPPVRADGTPYPQMNAANTSTWTHVPADPWATTIKYVDLTQLVTDRSVVQLRLEPGPRERSCPLPHQWRRTGRDHIVRGERRRRLQLPVGAGWRRSDQRVEHCLVDRLRQGQRHDARTARRVDDGEGSQVLLPERQHHLVRLDQPVVADLRPAAPANLHRPGTGLDAAGMRRRDRPDLRRGRRADLRRHHDPGLQRRGATDLQQHQPAGVQRCDIPDLQRTDAAGLRRRRRPDLQRHRSANLRRRRIPDLQRHHLANLRRRRRRNPAAASRRRPATARSASSATASLRRPAST